MKYAIVNNIKSEARKGIKGYCPNCNAELTAKCGDYKIHHWSHKKTRNCDTWWEPETEWHRTWKNYFPIEWQESILYDELNGEKHIADIRTPQNLVIEFQHSHIDPNERNKREKFYKNMVWVVDGTRLKRDYPRFLKASSDFLQTDKKGILFLDYSDEVFPTNWLNSSVPVIFDFKALETINDINDKRNYLYCLFHVRKGRYSILAEIPFNAFVKSIINGEWTLRIQSFIESLNPKKVQIPKQPSNTKTKQNNSPYFYDPRKGRFIKKRRL
jgi:competence protein CoiA